MALRQIECTLATMFEANRMTLDAIDKQTISMIQENGRLSCGEIADNVDRTEIIIRCRAKCIEKEGIIKRFTIFLEAIKSPF